MKANTAYLRSKTGALNCYLLFMLLVCLICIAVTDQSSGTQTAFLVATISGFLVTFSLTMVKLFGVDEKLKLPWAFIEFVYVIIWAIFFLVVSAFALNFGGTYIAPGIFGLVVTCAYIVKIVYIYKTEVVQQNTPTLYPSTQ